MERGLSSVHQRRSEAGLATVQLNVNSSKDTHACKMETGVQVGPALCMQHTFISLRAEVLLANGSAAENCSAQVKCLPSEPQEGNIEYKYKLISPTPERLEHLVTQLKWRLEEGAGVAVYEIGVHDDGTPTGLSAEDLRDVSPQAFVFGMLHWRFVIQ